MGYKWCQHMYIVFCLTGINMEGGLVGGRNGAQAAGNWFKAHTWHGNPVCIHPGLGPSKAFQFINKPSWNPFISRTLPLVVVTLGKRSASEPMTLTASDWSADSENRRRWEMLNFFASHFPRPFRPFGKRPRIYRCSLASR